MKKSLDSETSLAEQPLEIETPDGRGVVNLCALLVVAGVVSACGTMGSGTGGIFDVPFTKDENPTAFMDEIKRKFLTGSLLKNAISGPEEAKRCYLPPVELETEKEARFVTFSPKFWKAVDGGYHFELVAIWGEEGKKGAVSFDYSLMKDIGADGRIDFFKKHKKAPFLRMFPRGFTYQAIQTEFENSLRNLTGFSSKDCQSFSVVKNTVRQRLLEASFDQ